MSFDSKNIEDKVITELTDRYSAENVIFEGFDQFELLATARFYKEEEHYKAQINFDPELNIINIIIQVNPYV